jgi:NAD(P)-dependent dehydrogenase (short-subunit alcohol dehydrogenase family)
MGVGSSSQGAPRRRPVDLGSSRCCRSAEKLQKVASSCGAAACDVAVLPLDLCGEEQQLLVAAQQADELFGGAGVDFLIHNAGGLLLCCRAVLLLRCAAATVAALLWQAVLGAPARQPAHAD